MRQWDLDLALSQAEKIITVLHQFSEMEYSVFANNFHISSLNLINMGQFTLNRISIRYMEIIWHFLSDNLNFFNDLHTT